MKKSIKSIYLVIANLILVFATVVSICAQSQKPSELTLDQQIKVAEEANAKLKRLNAILEENKRIKEANNRLQEESAADLFIPASEADKKDGATILTPVVMGDPKATISDTPPQTVSNTQENSNKGTKGFTGPNKTGPTTPTNSTDPDSTDTKATTKSTDDSTATTSTDATPDPDKEDADRASCEALVDTIKDQTGNEMNLCLLAINIADKDELTLSTRLNSVKLAKALSGLLLANKPMIDIQATRTDKQIGADSKNVGTTNLVSRGGIPLIMSLAVENGAATSTANGTTINFRFNPVGLMEYLNKGGTDNFAVFQPSEPFVKQLRRMALGLSYDTSRGVVAPMFTGSRDQFSGLSFSYGFVDQRSPSTDFVREKTRAFVIDAGATFSQKSVKSLEAIFSLGQNDKQNTIINNFIGAINEAIKAKKTDFENKNKDEKIALLFPLLIKEFAKAPADEIKKNTAITEQLKEFTAALDSYETAEKDFQRKLNRAQLLTFDYNYNRSFTASDLSNFNLTYEKGWENGMDLVFNSSFSMFHKTPFRSLIAPGTVIQPTEQKKFRDFSFASQLDIPLTGLTGSVSDFTLSLAAKYQRMLTDSVTLFDGTVINGIKGDIVIGQAKMRIPMGKTGLFFPISFTYANRPELIKEKKSRGNFGFTFDLSSLLERFSPFR